MKNKFFAIISIGMLLGFCFNVNLASAANKTARQKVVVNKKARVPAKIIWTAAALRELRRVPRFVRATVRAKVNAYAIKHHIKVITPKIYNSIHV